MTVVGSERLEEVLVRSPTTQVMGIVLFDLYSEGKYPLVAAMSDDCSHGRGRAGGDGCRRS